MPATLNEYKLAGYSLEYEIDLVEFPSGPENWITLWEKGNRQNDVFMHEPMGHGELVHLAATEWVRLERLKLRWAKQTLIRSLQDYFKTEDEDEHLFACKTAYDYDMMSFYTFAHARLCPRGWGIDD